MRLEIDVMLDYQLPQPADVLLQVEVAQMADQRLIGDTLSVSAAEPLRSTEGGESLGRRSWARGQGAFHATYSALVEVERPSIDLAALAAPDPRTLPALVVPYLLPSRYIEAERFESYVAREFGGAEGGARLLAMRDWVAAKLDYVAGASDGDTGAAETFVQRRGVCRDYAHLLAAFARAAKIPARIVSAYAPQVEPQDFHAVVEVWLADSWHLIDATGMASCEDIVRIAVGRDATDTAFMTVFGAAEMKAQTVRVARLD